MSEYLGSRISLISKSDIRYVGLLHEINSDESTVSLENVRSFGTEGRKSRLEEEIAASDQVYEYIVFRGSDVKDLRIEESPPVKETKAPAVPNDPAILGARPRPDAARPGPAAQSVPAIPAAPGPSSAPGGPPLPGPPGYGPLSQPFNNFYGPPGAWGRGGPPGPGAGFGNMPYPPPPGWYPGGFPPGPGGPGPWNNYHLPPGAPMPGPMPGQDPSQKNRATPVATPGQEQKQPGPPLDKQKGGPSMPQPPTEPKSLAQGALQPQGAPTPPVESKPSVDQVKAAAASSSAATSTANGAKDESKTMPTGPKNNRVAPVIPAMPRPFQVPTSIAGQQSGSKATSSAPTAASIQDATEAAKAAVAIAMAKMEGGSSTGQAQAGSKEQNGTPMDNLTKKVQEMRVNAARSGQHPRGRGRGGRGGHAKIEVPATDFDFASSNAKFNKETVVKEAIAGSPLAETDGSGAEAPEPTTTEVPAEAYNRQKSFFDNISSEAKDRAGTGNFKPGGREWRGEEQRKNIETFGQGSVDGGYRNYRGRGRGRGGMRGGRGGYQRGGRGGYRNRDNQNATSSAQQ